MVLKAEKKKRINSRDPEFDTIYALSSEKEKLNTNLPYDEEIENLCDYNLSTLKKIHSILVNCSNLSKKEKLAFCEGERSHMKLFLKSLMNKIDKSEI